VIPPDFQNPKGYPDPTDFSAKGSPNKSFIIIDLIEIDTAPEGTDAFAFRLYTRFQDYLG
jgi:hypothetical protein